MNLVKRLEARAPGTIPAQPGFCIDNGFVHEPTPAGDNEAISIFVLPKGHPDVAIRLDSAINRKRLQESLLIKDANNNVKRAHPSHFRSFRKGARILNGIPGEEVLDKFKESNGTSSHSFMWVGLGSLNNGLEPKITLELGTGKGQPGEPVNSSLSDEAVLHLWNRMTSSLKVRKTFPSSQ